MASRMNLSVPKFLVHGRPKDLLDIIPVRFDGFHDQISFFEGILFQVLFLMMIDDGCRKS